MSKAKRIKALRKRATSSTATLWDDLPDEARLKHNGANRKARRRAVVLKRRER